MNVYRGLLASGIGLEVYNIGTRSSTKASGEKPPEVHGADKPLDPNLKPGSGSLSKSSPSKSPIKVTTPKRSPKKSVTISKQPPEEIPMLNTDPEPAQTPKDINHE